MVVGRLFTFSTIAGIRWAYAQAWHTRRVTLLGFLRLNRGLSQAEAARLVRMLLTDYTLVERGLQQPSEVVATRLKAAFGYASELLVADVFEILTDALGKREATHVSR